MFVPRRQSSVYPSGHSFGRTMDPPWTFALDQCHTEARVTWDLGSAIKSFGSTWSPAAARIKHKSREPLPEEQNLLWTVRSGVDDTEHGGTFSLSGWWHECSLQVISAPILFLAINFHVSFILDSGDKSLILRLDSVVCTDLDHGWDPGDVLCLFCVPFNLWP